MNVQPTQLSPNFPNQTGVTSAPTTSASQPQIAPNGGAFNARNQQRPQTQSFAPTSGGVGESNDASSGPTPSDLVMGYTVGANRTFSDSTPPALEASLPANSPSGGTYTYQLKSDATTGFTKLYRHDDATGQWQSANLPATSGGKVPQYSLQTDGNGNQFVRQTYFSQTDGMQIHAVVPGEFSPSNAPEASAAAPTSAVPAAPSNYTVEPEYQLPQTGPHGEQYSYSIENAGGDNGNAQTRMVWHDQTNGWSAHADLPSRGEYSIQTDAQGHQYLNRYTLDSGFNPDGPQSGPVKVSDIRFQQS